MKPMTPWVRGSLFLLEPVSRAIVFRNPFVLTAGVVG
jgi:hypothetical protein